MHLYQICKLYLFKTLLATVQKIFFIKNFKLNKNKTIKFKKIFQCKKAATKNTIKMISMLCSMLSYVSIKLSSY